MRVWRDAVAVRDFEPEDERPILGRVTFEDGDLRPFGQGWGAITPFQRRRRIEHYAVRFVLGFGLRLSVSHDGK